MNFEEIYLSYNLDLLIDIYENIKYKSFYNGVLDNKTNSSDFVNIIIKNIEYAEIYNEDDDSGDEHEYYNYET